MRPEIVHEDGYDFQIAKKQRIKENDDYELNDRMKAISDRSKALASHAKKIISEMIGMGVNDITNKGEGKCD